MNRFAMMKRYGAAGCLVGLAAIGFGGTTVHAAPMQQKAFDDFDYVWRFDNTENLNANFDLYDNATGLAGADGINDWRYNTGSTAISVTDGAMVIDNLRNENYLWQSIPQITPTSGFTQEYRIRINDRLETNGTQAAAGMAVDVGPGGGQDSTGLSFLLNTDTGKVDIHWTIRTDTAPNLKASVDAGDYFTVRVAAVYNAETEELDFSLYVNDNFIADLTAATSAGSYDRMFVGTISSVHGGNMSVDAIGFTPDGFAVPEPGSMSLLALGTMALLCKRRG